MPGKKLNYYGSTNTSLTNIMEVIDAQRVGKEAFGITNISTTSVSAIEAASVIEIGGAYYRFSTEEPISTSNITSNVSVHSLNSLNGCF